MRVVVLGGGVVGVATAWYLAEAGYEVTVVERRDGVARETSFGNAGQISPGLSAPWASPGVLRQALLWQFSRHKPLILHPRADWALAKWLTRFVANCNADAYKRNKRRMVRLAQYSRDCLEALRGATGIAYDEGQRGLLNLFRTEGQVAKAALDTAVLDELGIAWRLLDREGVFGQEPALRRVGDKIAGGLLLPGDESGDVHLFTTRLAEMAAARQVMYRFGVRVSGLRAEGCRIGSVMTEGGPIEAEAFVVAAGSATPALLRGLGIDLPVVPVKGYSLTFQVTDEAAAPVSTMVDDSYKVGITRLGSRIRAGGMAELAGYSDTLPERRRRTLEHVVGDLFPGGGRVDRDSFWTGLRAMTPDGVPYVCGTGFANLFVNTGHGTLGWTMACGSGAMMADLVSGKRPALEPAEYALAR